MYIQDLLSKLKKMLVESFELPRTLDPVSYTHLDVYKRQVCVLVDLQSGSVTSCVDFWSLSVWLPKIASGIYTGGDVYKRQE